MRRIAILLVFNFFLICLISDAKELSLVSAGKSRFNITIPFRASGSEIKASMILQEYIKKISGCMLPIVITDTPNADYQLVVGRSSKLTRTDTSGLGEDGLLIKRSGNNLYLTGGIRKGPLYAVYTFLEDYLGCKALSVGVIKVPATTSISLPEKIYKKEIPEFQYRMMHFPEGFDSTYCDWRKVNYMFEDWGVWVHTFSGLVPPDTYFKTHPEYFSLVGGTRTTDQLCLTNANVLNIVVNHLRIITRERPSAKYWSVSQNDNQEYCHCSNCEAINKREGTPMGSLLAFVNAVAEQLPGEIITTLAYGYSEKPPKSLRPGKNVMIMLATATAKDRRIPLHEVAQLPFNENFKKWSEITKELFVWDYLVQFENALLPFPNIPVFQQNIQYFAANNVKYIFLQGSGKMKGEFSELKAFLLSKLMWNKKANVKKLTTFFLNEYYGQGAGEYMNQYLNLIQANAQSNRVRLVNNGSLTPYLVTYLTPAHLELYKQLFQQALKKTTANSEVSKRVMKEYMAILFVELEHAKVNIKKAKKLAQFDYDTYMQKLEYWRREMKNLNLSIISESNVSVDEYYRLFRNDIRFKL